MVTVGGGVVPGVTVMVTGVPGGTVLGSWASRAGSGSSTPTRPAMSRFITRLPPKAFRARCPLPLFLQGKTVTTGPVNLSTPDARTRLPPRLPADDQARGRRQQAVVA